MEKREMSGRPYLYLSSSSSSLLLGWGALAVLVRVLPLRVRGRVLVLMRWSAFGLGYGSTSSKSSSECEVRSSLVITSKSSDTSSTGSLASYSGRFILLMKESEPYSGHSDMFAVAARLTSVVQRETGRGDADAKVSLFEKRVGKNEKRFLPRGLDVYASGSPVALLLKSWAGVTSQVLGWTLLMIWHSVVRTVVHPRSVYLFCSPLGISCSGKQWPWMPHDPHVVQLNKFSQHCRVFIAIKHRYTPDYASWVYSSPPHSLIDARD